MRSSVHYPAGDFTMTSKLFYIQLVEIKEENRFSTNGLVWDFLRVSLA